MKVESPVLISLKNDKIITKNHKFKKGLIQKENILKEYSFKELLEMDLSKIDFLKRDLTKTEEKKLNFFSF